MVDLTKYKTPAAAAKNLAKWLNEQGWSACVWSPEESKKMIDPNADAWHVACEECPWEGLIALSLGGSIYAGEFGYYDSNGNYKEPEVKLTGSKHWVAEPYHGWNLGFYPDNY